MKKITSIALSFVALFTAKSVVGQDIHWSQWYNAPIYYNPAATGAFNGDERAKVNYKDQWRSISSPYKTFMAQFDMPFLKKKWKKGFIGGGLVIYDDKAGDSRLGTTQANLSVAGHVMINSHNAIAGGLVGGFAQKSINYDKLQWGNQYDPNSGAYNSSLSTGEPAAAATAQSFGDFGMGFLWSYGKGDIYSSGNNQFRANAGVSFLHANQPRINFLGGEDKTYSKLVAHASITIGLKGTNIAIMPNILYCKQGPSEEILPGGLVRYTLVESSRYTGNIKESAISFGGHLRTTDSFIATVLGEYANYAFGISYDVNISALSSASRGKGGIEISLSYYNPNPFRYSQKERF